MTPNAPAPSSTHVGRLSAALQEYQAALDLGLPVDRAALLARHPDLPNLSSDLHALDDLHGAGAELAAGLPGRPSAEPTLADFEIVREAGRGGMGVVYEAIQRSLGRRVAVKVLTQAAALDDRTRRRFLHEARAAALVDHPNVVPVFHVGEEHGVPYYVMPFIDGSSLARHRPAGDFAFVARVGAAAAGALSAAHAQGVIHRDIKPANLLLGPGGKVWVADFGLALAPFTGALTQTGGRPGTPRYMSPEQLTGRRDALDGRTDIYSLGVTLYELAAGRPAFTAADDGDPVRAILEADFPRLRSVAPEVPVGLETVILKAMAFEPADRYPTAGDMAADLRRFLDGVPVLARRPGPLVKGRRWVTRHRRTVAVTVGIALLAAGSIQGLTWRAYRAEAAARAEAERNRTLAVAAVGSLGNASDSILSHAPGLEERKLRYLTECRDVVEPFAEDASLPVAVRRDIAAATFRLAEAYLHARRFADAEASFRTLLARLEALAAAAPDDFPIRRDTAQALEGLGRSLRDQRRYDEARGAFYRALATAERAHALAPEAATGIVRLGEIRCLLAEADERQTGSAEATLQIYLDVAATYDALRDRYRTGHPRSYMRLVYIRNAIALRYVAAGKLDEAEREYGKAVEADDVLATEFRDEPANIRDAGWHLRGEWGRLMCARGRVAEGRALIRRSVQELETAVGLYPHAAQYRARLISVLGTLAVVEHLADNRDASRTAAVRCADLLAKMDVAVWPACCAQAWLTMPFADLKSKAVGERLLACHPDVRPLWVRAALLHHHGRTAEALTALGKENGPAEEFVRACCGAKSDPAAAVKVYDAAAARFEIEPLRWPEVQFWQRETAARLVAVRPR